MTDGRAAEIGRAADAIEAAMREAGMWQAEPPDPAAFDFQAAFAVDTMAFSQWLQWVFLPHVREMVAAGGGFPASSHVAAHAVREWDGYHEAAGVLDALHDFDARLAWLPGRR